MEPEAEQIVRPSIPQRRRTSCGSVQEEASMNSIIYIVGLVVVVLFILSFLGLR